jgi:hypothetical protein
VECPESTAREIERAAGRQRRGFLDDKPVRLHRPDELALGVPAIPNGLVHRARA